MDALALELPLLQPVIERQVGRIRYELIVQAVHAFRIGAVLAQHLRGVLVLGVDCGAVEAFAEWAVSALGLIRFVLLCLFVFLALPRFGLTTDAVEALSSWRVIALGVGVGT